MVLTSNHHIGGPLDSINERLSATVQVVELALCDRVVDVDGGDGQTTLLHHAVQVVHSCGGLLADALDSLQVLWVLLVDEVGQVTAIVQDHVEGLAILEDERLLDAPQVLLLCLALPREHRNAGLSDGRGGVILCAEDVAAAPLDLERSPTES